MIVTVSHRGEYSHAEAQRSFEHVERYSHTEVQRERRGRPLAAKRETEGTESDLRSLTPQTLKNSFTLKKILLNLQMSPRLSVR